MILTFFVFSDYANPALRTAAIMKANSLFVFTTTLSAWAHEPVEHLTSLRAVPHMTDFRPGGRQ